MPILPQICKVSPITWIDVVRSSEDQGMRPDWRVGQEKWGTVKGDFGQHGAFVYNLGCPDGGGLVCLGDIVNSTFKKIRSLRSC